MIPMMTESLLLPDEHGFTVLHQCCDMLRKDMPRSDFLMGCLRNLVDHANSQGFGEYTLRSVPMLTMNLMSVVCHLRAGKSLSQNALVT